MKAVYIRFSDDINADIRRGHSFDVHGERLPGICAWKTNFDLRMQSTSELIDMCKAKAVSILNNTYGSYSSNSTAYVLTGDYVGNGNDGVLLKNIEIIESIKI